MTTSTPFRDLLHAVNLRHGTDGFTSPPKEGVLRIFSPWKILTASAGFEPANLGTLRQLPLDHRSRLHIRTYIYCMSVCVYCTYIYTYIYIYRVIKKSLCTWWLQYRRQGHIDFLITLYYVCTSAKGAVVRTQNQHCNYKMRSITLRTTFCTHKHTHIHTRISENQFFPTTAVQQRQHVDAVGCHTCFSGLAYLFSIFWKLQVGALHPLAPPLNKQVPECSRDVAFYSITL